MSQAHGVIHIKDNNKCPSGNDGWHVEDLDLGEIPASHPVFLSPVALITPPSSAADHVHTAHCKTFRRLHCTFWWKQKYSFTHKYSYKYQNLCNYIFEYYNCYTKTVECYWLSLPVLRESFGKITTGNLQCIYINAEQNFTQFLKELAPLVNMSTLQEADQCQWKYCIVLMVWIMCTWVILLGIICSSKSKFFS